MTVTPDSFATACDRLSHIVDDVQFERLRWARTEGPMLAHLVALAQAAVEQRSDFELTEEGNGRDRKQFILKIHMTRIATVAVALDMGRAVLTIEETAHSKYCITPGDPVSTDFTQADAAWMAGALETLFGRIEAR
jgi:hypothetical protein